MENESKNNRNEISDLTVIALVTSILLAPVGWFLGFRARKEIEKNGGYGRPFATAAIWIGGIITIGFIAMIAVGSLTMGYGEHGNGFGFRNHMMFNNDDRSLRGPNFQRDGRGMMGWFDDSSTATNNG